MNAILESVNAVSAAGLTAVLNTLWLALAVAAVMWFALRLMPRVNAATRHAVWWAVLALVVLMPLTKLRPRPAQQDTARTEEPMQTRVPPSSRVLPFRREAPPSSRRSCFRSAAPFHCAACTRFWLSGSASHSRSRGVSSGKLGVKPADSLDGRLWSSTGPNCAELSASPPPAESRPACKRRIGSSFPAVPARLPHFARSPASGVRCGDFSSGRGISAPGHHSPGDPPQGDWGAGTRLRAVSRTGTCGSPRRLDQPDGPAGIRVSCPSSRGRVGLAPHRAGTEIACDDWVVAATGSAVHYAATLARLFEFCCTRRRELLASAMAHRSSNISERIKTLLRPRLHRSPGASLLRVSFCVAAGLALLSLGMRMPGWIAFGEGRDRHCRIQAGRSPSSPLRYPGRGVAGNNLSGRANLRGGAFPRVPRPVFRDSASESRGSGQDLAARMEAHEGQFFEQAAVLSHQPQ